MNKAAKTIVILGGGVGGLVAANELRQLVPSEHRIVLIEKNRQHAFAPSFLWLMTGDRRPKQISRDVQLLVQKGVELLHGEARGIDLAAHRVETSIGSVTYDFLVVALGAELAPDTAPGLAESAQTFYTLMALTNCAVCFATSTGERSPLSWRHSRSSVLPRPMKARC